MPQPHSWQRQHYSLLFVVAFATTLVLASVRLVVGSYRHHHSSLVPTIGSVFPFRVPASDFVVIPTLCPGFHPLADNHVVDCHNCSWHSNPSRVLTHQTDCSRILHHSSHRLQ